MDILNEIFADKILQKKINDTIRENKRIKEKEREDGREREIEEMNNEQIKSHYKSSANEEYNKTERKENFEGKEGQKKNCFSDREKVKYQSEKVGKTGQKPFSEFDINQIRIWSSSPLFKKHNARTIRTKPKLG